MVLSNCHVVFCTDYEGDDVYGDFYETDATAVPSENIASYEPGLWRKDLVSGMAEYLHNDHLGTLRATSPSGVTGGLGAQRVYTALGEVVAGPTDRFGYVGAHGYQAHDGVPFLHVGAQYYDPSSGRFLQRDPVGIRGGMNTYGYVENEPLTSVDPEGERKVVQHLWRMEEEKKRRERENFVGPPLPEIPRPQPPRRPRPGSREDIQDELKRERVKQIIITTALTLVIPFTTGAIMKCVATGASISGSAAALNEATMP